MLLVLISLAPTSCSWRWIYHFTSCDNRGTLRQICSTQSLSPSLVLVYILIELLMLLELLSAFRLGHGTSSFAWAEVQLVLILVEVANAANLLLLRVQVMACETNVALRFLGWGYSSVWTMVSVTRGEGLFHQRTVRISVELRGADSSSALFVCFWSCLVSLAHLCLDLCHCLSLVEALTH